MSKVLLGGLAVAAASYLLVKTVQGNLMQSVVSLFSALHTVVLLFVKLFSAVVSFISSSIWVVYFRLVVTLLKITQPQYKINKKSQDELSESYDAIILGSGFCGNILATVLASVGMKILVVDVVEHPRPVIGESTVPKSTVNINRLASKFAIPELCDLTKYAFVNVSKFRKFPKAYFSFYNTKAETQKLIVMPVGDPDTHVKREVIDQYLAQVSSKYGCDHYIGRYEFDEHTESIRIGDRTIDSTFIFDATGRRKLLTDYVSEGKIHPTLLDTRAFWFRLSYDELDFDCLDKEFVNKDSLYSYWASTHHLIFDEGWAWIIPLDDKELSIGFVLRTDMSTIVMSENLEMIYSKYPKVARLFKHSFFVGKSIVRRDHVQFCSHKMRRGKVILTPFTMGFNDALFSNGITLISSWVWRVGHIFQGYKSQCDKGLKPYVISFINSSLDTFGNCVRDGLLFNDTLIKAMYCSFDDWSKFCHSLVLWQVATTFYELSDQHDQSNLDFFGAGNDWLRDCCSRVARGEHYTEEDIRYMTKFMAEGRFESCAEAMDQIRNDDQTVYLYELGYYSLKFLYTRDLDYKVRTVLDSLLFWKKDYRYHNWLLKTFCNNPRLHKSQNSVL